MHAGARHEPRNRGTEMSRAPRSIHGILNALGLLAFGMACVNGLLACAGSPDVLTVQEGPAASSNLEPEPVEQTQEALPAVVCATWFAACVAGCKIHPDVDFCVSLCQIIYEGCKQAPAGQPGVPQGGVNGDGD